MSNLTFKERIEKMKLLKDEYLKLKYEVFGDNMFVVINRETEEARKQANRYDQLFQFFYPEYRTTSYVSPL